MPARLSSSRYSAPEDRATAASFFPIRSIDAALSRDSRRSAVNLETRLVDNSETNTRLLSIHNIATIRPLAVLGVLSPYPRLSSSRQPNKGHRAASRPRILPTAQQHRISVPTL